MSKKKGSGGDKGGKKGGKGKGLLVMVTLLCAGGVAFWFLAPEQANRQLEHLRALLGL